MTKIILGIHGLANKPPAAVLREYWRRAIEEGLARTGGGAATPLPFSMVYWADLLYKHPLHGDANFDFDRLYNDEPYVADEADSVPRHRDGALDTVVAGALGLVGATLDRAETRLEIDTLADWVVGKTLKDLAFYYDPLRLIADRGDPPQRAPARTVLQDELQRALRPLKGQEIMLIAHSMGSIIAYDVLRDIGRADPGFEVAQFVTIGSPLGLPHVKRKIIAERAYDGPGRGRVRTPSIVTERWVNYADRRDPVALDAHLGDDYRANRHGVSVEDDLVVNGYRSPAGDANPHKSYGYLRTPELSALVRDFLRS